MEAPQFFNGIEEDGKLKNSTSNRATELIKASLERIFMCCLWKKRHLSF